MWPSLEPKSAAVHQISLKSDDPRLRYGDEIIFKMAAVCHLEFSKIATFVTWRLSEHGSTCTYQISCKSDNNSCRCSQKTIFNMAAVRHFECHIFINQHVTDLGTKIWFQDLLRQTYGYLPSLRRYQIYTAWWQLTAQDINPIAYAPEFTWPNFAPRPGFEPRPVPLIRPRARI